MIDVKCGCGKEGRYSTGIDGEWSCNKYQRCPTYEEQEIAIGRLRQMASRYELALKKIVKVSATDYEYKAWAKGALDA